jgi:hypothetical protein
MRLRRRVDLARVNRITAADLSLPQTVWKSCPWQPRELVETGLRQWLRCAGAALRDGQVIGMPSHAVDEAWHGLILCTARYAAFCQAAYGQFLHHQPDSTGLKSAGPMPEQLARTVVAWTLVAAPGETCVLWDLDDRLGVDTPWGVTREQVDAVVADLAVARAR